MSFQYPWFLALIPVLLWLFRRKQSRTSVTVDAITEASNMEPGRARYLWLSGCLRKLSVLAVLIALAGPCLLYTSPSPRDGLLSRMPSSA